MNMEMMINLMADMDADACEVMMKNIESKIGKSAADVIRGQIFFARMQCHPEFFEKVSNAVAQEAIKELDR